MTVEGFGDAAALASAIGLATERVVAAVRATFPELTSERRVMDGQDDTTGSAGKNSNNGNHGRKARLSERQRLLITQAIAFLAAWITTAFLAEGQDFGLLGVVTLVDGARVVHVPVPFLALLGMGSSAVFSPLITLATEARNVQRERAVLVESARLERERQAAAEQQAAPASQGTRPVGSPADTTSVQEPGAGGYQGTLDSTGKAALHGASR